MKRLIVLGLIASALLVLASCGGGDDEREEPTATTSPDAPTETASATPSPTRSAVTIGEVDDADGNARVNGERASQNLKLRAADRIETGASSSIDFTLTGAPAVECRTRANSQLQLRPDPATVIKWLSRTGVSYCTVERGEPAAAARFGLEPNIQIDVEGTLFGISESTLRVVEGFVTYRWGSATQRLGPREEITFLISGGPGQKQVWDGLDPDESAMIADLQSRLPPVSLTPTTAEWQTSKLINAMQGQPALYVLLDDSAQLQDAEFVSAYFERLAEVWFGIGSVQIERVNRAGAMLVLAQKAFAVYVAPPAPPLPTATPPRGSPTPTRTQTAGPATSTPLVSRDLSPFYVDAAERVWSIEFPTDAGAKSAFARFTKGILTNGDYYDLYASIFEEAPPPYDRLLELLK